MNRILLMSGLAALAFFAGGNGLHVPLSDLHPAPPDPFCSTFSLVALDTANGDVGNAASWTGMECTESGELS